MASGEQIVKRGQGIHTLSVEAQGPLVDTSPSFVDWDLRQMSPCHNDPFQLPCPNRSPFDVENVQTWVISKFKFYFGLLGSWRAESRLFYFPNAESFLGKVTWYFKLAAYWVCSPCSGLLRLGQAATSKTLTYWWIHLTSLAFKS